MDLPNLSKEDVSVLALCIQIDGELVTDDYTVSNVAKHLELKVTPIMTKGISKILDSVYFCPACNKVQKNVRLSHMWKQIKEKISREEAFFQPLNHII